jgi:hypothetical protein
LRQRFSTCGTRDPLQINNNNIIFHCLMWTLISQIGSHIDCSLCGTKKWLRSPELSYILHVIDGYQDSKLLVLNWKPFVRKQSQEACSILWRSFLTKIDSFIWFFLIFFWCDLHLFAVFGIIIVFLPSSGPSYPSSF